MDNILLEQIQKLADGRHIPQRLQRTVEMLLCGDEDCDCHDELTAQDAKLVLTVLYGWQRNASPQRPCPVCHLIRDTCPYHMGVDDAIESDLAASVRYRWRPPSRWQVALCWFMQPRVRTWLWVTLAFGVFACASGLTTPRLDVAAQWTAYAGFLVTLLSLAAVVAHMMLVPPWRPRNR